MAVDEYYSVTAAKAIACTGNPAFACGGDYFRAPLFHYFAAALIRVTSPESAVAVMRILSALANVATVPAIFLLARQVNKPAVGLIASVVFLFSVWEIEFSRFARMYAFFGCLAVWQVYFTQRYAQTGGAGYFLLSIAFAVMGTLTWAGGAFLIALPAAVWWLKREWPQASKVVLFGAAVLAILYFRGIGPFSGGGSTLLGGDGLLLNPLDKRFTSVYLSLAAALAALGGVAAFRFRSALSEGQRDWVTILTVIGVLLSAALGFLLVPMLVLLMFLIASHQSGTARANLAIGCAIYVALCMLAWTGLLLFEGRGYFKVAVFLADYPDVWRRVVVPWWEVMPIWSVVLALGVGASVLRTFGNSAPVEARVLVASVFVLVALTTAIDTDYVSTRYSYYIYPLVILLAFMGFSFALHARLNRPAINRAAFLLAIFSPFAISEDHRLERLFALSEYDQVFRVGMPRELARHYYVREDYAAVGRFINERANADDVVIVTHQAQSAYLQDIDFVLKDPASVEFLRVLCADGRTERWTNRPLIGTLEEVESIRRGTADNYDVWLVSQAPEAESSERRADIQDEYEDYEEFRSGDGRLIVFRLPGTAKRM